MTPEHSPSALYSRLERHCASNASPVIGFLWGLAEGTVFFVVPDVYLGFAALFCWGKALRATIAAVAGALIGGAVLYALAANNGTAMTQLLVRIPLIRPEMVRTVTENMQRDGLGAMVSGPFQGIPYKIYAVQAGQQRLPLVPFLLVTILARLERLLPVTVIGAVSGVALRVFIQRRTALAVGAYALMWVGVYGLYYFLVR